MLDDELKIRPMTNMNVARYSAPSIMLKDNYILVAGGIISGINSSKKLTTSTEIYDISKNMWQPLSVMDKPRANTSMCAIKDRHVFIFNGMTSSSSSSTIEYIDLGGLDQISLKQARWKAIGIKDQDFLGCDSRASAAINNQTQILIFGGNKRQTFCLNVETLSYPQNQNLQQSWASKNTNQFVLQRFQTELLCDSRFCIDGDFSIRTFGNYLYSVDCERQNLHVFSLKDKQWNFSKLKDLGIP